MSLYKVIVFEAIWRFLKNHMYVCIFPLPMCRSQGNKGGPRGAKQVPRELPPPYAEAKNKKYWWLYPQRSINILSPVCRIFWFLNEEILQLWDKKALVISKVKPYSCIKHWFWSTETTYIVAKENMFLEGLLSREGSLVGNNPRRTNFTTRHIPPICVTLFYIPVSFDALQDEGFCEGFSFLAVTRHGVAWPRFKELDLL